MSAHSLTVARGLVSHEPERVVAVLAHTLETRHLSDVLSLVQDWEKTCRMFGCPCEECSAQAAQEGNTGPRSLAELERGDKEPAGLESASPSVPLDRPFTHAQQRWLEHELLNPLAIISANLQVLEGPEWGCGDSNHRLVLDALRAVNRIERIVRELADQATKAATP